MATNAQQGAMGRQIATFEELISEHGKRTASACRLASGKAALYRDILDEFMPVYERSVEADAQRAAKELVQIRAVLDGYEAAIEQWQKRQVDTADEFNLLEVLGLIHKEGRHSMMLAWLLDRDIMHYGTHAQGCLGFRLFLEELKLPVEYAGTRYCVSREVSGEESRVDIEIAARGRFLIHIENKIWSGEGSNQTRREWSDMQRRAEALDIPAIAGKVRIHGLFLTPEGVSARTPNFQAVSWRQVARVLDRFAVEARPPDVKLFASHYARTLRRFIIEETQEEEPDRGQETI